jgi:hypothetical protein
MSAAVNQALCRNRLLQYLQQVPVQMWPTPGQKCLGPGQTWLSLGPIRNKTARVLRAGLARNEREALLARREQNQEG